MATNSADQFPAVAGPQPNRVAVLEGEDAKAVVLQFQPSPAGTLLAGVGWHGTMKPGGRRRFGRTQRCGVRINIHAPFSANGRAESLRQLGASFLGAD
jgi:hypothetical protein